MAIERGGEENSCSGQQQVHKDRPRIRQRIISQATNLRQDVHIHACEEKRMEYGEREREEEREEPVSRERLAAGLTY